MAKTGYEGKIKNVGPQEVPALHNVKGQGGTVKAIRGTDLRSGK